MAVKKSSYRLPPTPQGLKAMEKGTLNWFDIEMFSNLNTGCMEQYFEEKNRVEGFKFRFPWNKIVVGIVLGTIFALITEYVGLKVGIALSGGWYVVYIIGLALRWPPNDINIVAGASTGATYISTGFIFTFPALYLLAKSEEFELEGGAHFIDASALSTILPVALVATIFAGMLGVLYFIIFRRIWLVEDPLHVPGFEANVKLLDMANSISKGGIQQARRAIKLIGVTSGITMFFTFLRDWPVFDETTIFDKLLGNTYYEYGDIIQPYNTAKYTHLSFGLVPINFSIGWFMKFRTAFLVNAGTFLTWFVIVPLAVGFNIPVYVSNLGYYLSMEDASISMGLPSALVAFRNIGRIIAIGTIIGGGLTGLLKMLPTFKTAAMDVFQSGKGERRDFVKGRGWYEWPVSHIKIMVAITFIAISVIFICGGYPPIQSILFSLILVITTFFIGAIAVKVMGETGSEPVSGCSFIVLLLLVGIFALLGTSPELTAIMAIMGTAVFGGAISMSGDIIWDFKSGLYCGNRPYYLMKGELTGIIPGAIVSAIGAVILSEGLATGKLHLIAPQAKAFATTVLVVLSGQTGIQTVQLLLLGIGIGVFIELLTGMGTAFGLGMYFPLSIALTMLLGGVSRDLWEKKWLEPRVKREKWTEKQKTLKVLDTYMVATGLMVGEALMGTIVAIYIMLLM